MKFPAATITVTGANGASFVQEKTPNDIIFTDKNGKQYTVAANAPAGPIASSGQVAPGGIPTPKNTNGMGSGGVVAEISSPDVSVVFSKGDGKYAFDTAPTTQNGKLNKTYASLHQKSGGTYNVPFKAISNSPYEKDVIVATVDFKNGKTKKDLVFKTQNGTAIDSTQITWNGNVATLTLRKTLDFAKETVIATVRPAASKDPKEAAGKYDIAGTFDLWHLSNKKVNVTLVSVNGATLPNNAEKQLNEIYEPAGVTFVVNTTNISLDNSWGESIQTSESGLLATYTNEQQQITTNLQQKLGAAYKKDTYYIIYTDTPSDKSNILGFMPLKRQYGFIFNKNNTIRTLAHELGHGVFGLEHPFTEYNTTTTTDLLMDYDTGLALNHNDWQVIHAPGLQLYPFIQRDSDGELAKGFALAPDWSFVSNGDETTVKASGDTDTKGFLRGITTKEGTYIWKLKDGKYNYLHETTNKIYENPKVSPNANSTIWLFFENQNSRGKYIRTKYSVVEAIIKSKNETNLSKFIEKNRAKDLYTKGKDENRTTYWGYVGCSNCDNDGVENGNGSGGLVVDKTAKIPADELKQLIAQVSTSNQVNGINAKIFITAKDDTKGIAEVEKAIADLEKSNSREIYIWAKNYVANANFDLELAYGKGLSSKEKLDFDNFEATIQKINNQKESWLACLKFEGTYTYFNPLTAMLDGLAGLIGKAAIPAKYYNPDEPDYNSLPAKIYAYASGKIISEANSTDKYRASRQEFALVCGTWNGLVGTVEAIPAGVSMLMKLQGSAIDVIINHDGARDKLIKTLSNINKEQIDQILSTIGDEIEKGYKKYTKNPCMVSYASGQAVFVVASLFIGAGEANAAKTFLQTLEKLDVAGQLMGKVIAKAGKLVKCVLVKTGNVTKFVFKVGKAFFEPGLKLVKFGGETYCTLIPIPVDLSDNMAKAIEEAKKLLKDNKTRFEEALTPLKDENNAFLKDQDGNMLAEIEIDGQKITVLVNKDGTVLKNTAEEILQGTEKELLDAVTLASRLESPTFVVLKNEVNALGTLKPKFLEDFANASDDVLKELDDIVRFEDDYTAFKTLWKNSKAQDIKNNSTDIAKFKAWWYPNKAKVNNDFFINQKAYEQSLNTEYLKNLHLEKISSNVRGQYWNYYKQSQWDKLEALAKEYKINFDSYSNALWPPANGGYGPLAKRVPNMNEEFDRYGGSFGDFADGTPNLGGTYTSPMLNGKPYDFDGRALNIERNKYDFYYKIIIKDPSKFEIETNRAIPWFGKVGKAEQSRFIIKDLDPLTGRQKTWSQLAKEGSVEIQVIESPSGKYSTWVGKGRTISKSITASENTLSELKALGFTDDAATKIITKNKSLNLSEVEVKTLIQDLKNNSALIKAVTQNPENGIDAWKIFTDNKKAFCE